jgi:hypothetical protein
MAKYPSQHSPLEQKADKLWQAFSQTETEEFWRKYLALTKKAKRQEHTTIQGLQNPPKRPSHQTQTIASPAQAQASRFPLWQKIAIFTFLLLLAIFVGYQSIQTRRQNQLTNVWYGYTTNAYYTTVYDSIKTVKLLYLKEAVLRKSAQIKAEKVTLKTLPRLIDREWEQKLKMRDSLQQVFVQRHERHTQAQFHQKIKDFMFKDEKAQDRPRLDSLYALCQALRENLTPQIKQNYLKEGGGVNGCKPPENLSYQNQAVHNLFLWGKNTEIYFIVKKGKEICRVVKLGEAFYRFKGEDEVGTFETGDFIEKIDQRTSVYKAKLSLVYTDKNYPVKVGLSGAYYQTLTSDVYIKQKDRAKVKTQLKVELHRKAKQD